LETVGAGVAVATVLGGGVGLAARAMRQVRSRTNNEKNRVRIIRGNLEVTPLNLLSQKTSGFCKTLFD